MSAGFDLIYLDRDGDRTMSAVIWTEHETRQVGPWPAKEAGPKIVDALVTEPALGLADRADAEASYMTRHFFNMGRGRNDAGQDYPYRVTVTP